MTELFDTVLVANRGEIARRVIRTLRRLGIRSVAIYTDPDADAPHVHDADEAVRIGDAHAYLDIDAVISAAVRTGAQAIHPGYGFLSENAAFGRACAEAGIVFIGPGQRALDVMADKIRAKEHVAAHDVPTVPGFSAAGMTDAEIATAAEQAEYPLLIKPSAGGGGKGMQVVSAPEELDDALATARRVARTSFGDDTLLLERLIEQPRHIEVQVLADSHGTVIHLGERECTLQRRHQKVIEESPSPVIDETTRARLGAAASAAAASVDYRGAGTVEFLVSGTDPDTFFFIEMNTRLQVEHPVTEEVTGIDLVEQQLRIAAGEPLAIEQSDVRLEGHAIEALVYAESPARGFLPTTGSVLVAHWSDARSDAAVETGSAVTPDYDPMIAKVIAHAASRAEALAKLDAALADTVILGVETNIDFLRALLADPAVQLGDLDTGLIDRLPPFTDPAPSASALRIAALTQASVRHDLSESAPNDDRLRHIAGTASELWRTRDGWRMGADAVPRTVRFETSDGEILETTAPAHDASRLGDALPEGAVSEVDDGGTIWVHVGGGTWALRPLTRRDASAKKRAQRERSTGALSPELRSPMPGAVVAVHVTEGESVAAGQRIATIEAMKMEHPVTAPHEGIVHLDVSPGDQVSKDQLLAHIAPPTPTASDPSGDPGEAKEHP